MTSSISLQESDDVHFGFSGWDLRVWTLKWKQLSSTFLWYCLLCRTRWPQLSSLWMKSYYVTIQIKATDYYFPVVLFIMPDKAVLTFESVDEILKCDHSNESYWVVPLHGTIAFKQNKFTTSFHFLCLATLEGKETTKLLTSCPVVIRSLNLMCFRRSLITWK